VIADQRGEFSDVFPGGRHLRACQPCDGQASGATTCSSMAEKRSHAIEIQQTAARHPPPPRDRRPRPPLRLLRPRRPPRAPWWRYVIGLGR
jgi:hypothetical protein